MAGSSNGNNGGRIYTSEGYLIKAFPLFHREITPTRHFYLQRYKGTVYLHLREFTKDEMDIALIPTQRGVCLNRQQTADLLTEMNTLKEMVNNKTRQKNDTCKHFPDEMIDDLEGNTSESEDTEMEADELKLHIGRNVFAIAKRVYACVDLREFFFLERNKLFPTRRGLYLKKDQFLKVSAFLDEVKEVWKGLKEMPPCHLTHDSQKSTDGCNHCTPRFISQEEKANLRKEKEAAAAAAAARSSAAAAKIRRTPKAPSSTTDVVQATPVPAATTCAEPTERATESKPLKKRTYVWAESSSEDEELELESTAPKGKKVKKDST